MHIFSTLLFLLSLNASAAQPNHPFSITRGNAVTMMDIIELFGAEEIQADARNGTFFDVQEILCEVDSRMGGVRQPTCMIRFTHSDGTSSQLRPRNPQYPRVLVDFAKELRIAEDADEQRAGAKLVHIKDMRCQRAGRRAECRGKASVERR